MGSLVFDGSCSMPPAAAFITGTQAALLAIIVAATSLMMITQRRRRREGGPSPRAYAREQLARLKEEKVVHDELGEIMTQLQQVAREISAQLDAKFIRLERSVRDADDRIKRLEGLTREVRGRGSLDVTVADEGGGGTKTVAGDGGRTRRSEIYALADAGKTPLEIAGTVGSPAGEVELVLSLRGD